VRERLRDHLETSKLIGAGERVLVGYSGGADSTCLITLLVELGFDVVAAHLHHGMRTEADHEANLAEAYAQSLSVPFLLGHANVPLIAEQAKVGLEEAGRDARYNFFNRAAVGTECSLIATAHTADDQVETVLFRIIRGSGVAGLAGIPERRDNIVRPLLVFTRAETRGFCESRGLWFHDDPANVDLRHSRARLRHAVLPELEVCHPGARANLLRLAKIADEETRFLDGMAAAALEQSEYPLNGILSFLTNQHEVAFYRQRLETLPPVLFKRAIKLVARSLGAELTYDQTIQTASLGESGSITTEDGEVAIEWNPERIHARMLMVEAPFRHPLTVPGDTLADSLGWQISAVDGVYDGDPVVRRDRSAYISWETVRGPLYFRSAATGDEIQPLGFGNHRKVADLMSEAKLTVAARQRLPVVFDLMGPIWIPGVCVAERTRPKVIGESILRLSFGPLDNPMGTV
jgi:tRNA(Ile)-lysidine synthase